LLLQHATVLRLDEHVVSRHLLPSGYRPQDPEGEVRADIVIADLHSGRLFGMIGRLALDLVTVAWLVMLTTGLVMYSRGRGRNGQQPASEISAEHERYEIPIEGKRSVDRWFSSSAVARYLQLAQGGRSLQGLRWLPSFVAQQSVSTYCFEITHAELVA
jgi:hypothetical protein